MEGMGEGGVAFLVLFYSCDLNIPVFKNNIRIEQLYFKIHKEM